MVIPKIPSFDMSPWRAWTVLVQLYGSNSALRPVVQGDTALSVTI